MSQSATPISSAISAAPSATNMCDQKSPKPRVLLAEERSAWTFGKYSPQLFKSEYVTDASAIVEIPETWIFFGADLLRDT